MVQVAFTIPYSYFRTWISKIHVGFRDTGKPFILYCVTLIMNIEENLKLISKTQSWYGSSKNFKTDKEFFEFCLNS